MKIKLRRTINSIGWIKQLYAVSVEVAFWRLLNSILFIRRFSFWKNLNEEKLAKVNNMERVLIYTHTHTHSSRINEMNQLYKKSQRLASLWKFEIIHHVLLYKKKKALVKMANSETIQLIWMNRALCVSHWKELIYKWDFFVSSTTILHR